MSFLLRSCPKTLVSYTSHIVKRQAHKKANIQVKLNEFVDGVGIEGQVISVRPGLMRNILYPTGKATYIDKQNSSLEAEEKLSMEKKELEHAAEKLQSMTANKEKNKQLLGHLEDVRELKFNRANVPNSEQTFGSVTADDLVHKLKEEFGLDVDKSTIEFKSEGGRIKSLGQHQVLVQIGEQTTEINVIVDQV